MGGIEEGGGSVQEKVEKVRNRIREVLEEMERERAGGQGVKRGEGWGDEECKKKNMEVRRHLRTWRRGENRKKEYKRKKNIIRNYVRIM